MQSLTRLGRAASTGRHVAPSTCHLQRFPSRQLCSVAKQARVRHSRLHPLRLAHSRPATLERHTPRTVSSLGNLSSMRMLSTELKQSDHPLYPHVRLDPSTVDLVIFHGGCWDGMGAAWAAWKLLGDKAQYIPMQHHRRPPRVSGKTVAFLDICLPSVKMKAIQALAKDFIVVDHHVTAVAEVNSLPTETKIFDMSKSGAVLAWEFFHPGEEVPTFLRYIEDRDIWTWQLPESAEVNVALMTEPLTMDYFESLYQGGDQALEELKTAGRHMNKFATRTYEAMAKRAVTRTFHETGHRVRVVNCTTFKSEVGNLICENSDCDFALVWNYTHHMSEYWCSLRASQDSSVDVAIIAERFGGGGHPKAAAFTYKGAHIDDLFTESRTQTSTLVNPTNPRTVQPTKAATNTTSGTKITRLDPRRPAFVPKHSVQQ